MLRIELVMSFCMCVCPYAYTLVKTRLNGILEMMLMWIEFVVDSHCRSSIYVGIPLRTPFFASPHQKTTFLSSCSILYTV